MAEDRTPLPQLLAAGGWAVADPRPVAAAHPDTFELPTPGELAALRPGHHVRAMVDLADWSDEVRDGHGPWEPSGAPRLVPTRERMWFDVLDPASTPGPPPAEGTLRCELGNQPYASHTRLAVGAVVDLPLTHLIATDTSHPGDGRPTPGLPGGDLAPDDLRRPVDDDLVPHLHPDQRRVCDEHGVRPHRPWVFGRCLLARDLADAAEPVYGGRFPPDPDRDYVGWVVWAGYPDMAAAQAAVGFDLAMLQEVHRRRPEAWRYLSLPPGWGFTHADGFTDVYEIDITD